MKELKEIRMDSNVLVLDDNRVLSSIIPKKYADMDNDILIKGETIVDGAVYARQFEVEAGPVTVCGALFSKNSIASRQTNDTELRFRKAVASGGKIELCDAGKKLFGADVNGCVVSLKNAVIAANVFGSEISLENCVVLGGVFATKQLRLENSVVGTFNSPSATLGGDNYILYPSAFTVEPILFAEGSRMFNLTLADWGNLLKGLPENPMSGAIQIDPVADEQKVSLNDKNGNATLWETYSIAGKVLAADMLDLKKLDNHFMLSVGSLGEQLLKQYNFGSDKKGKPITLNLESLGEFFQSVQTGKIKVKPLDGKISFDELKRFYAEQ